MALLPAIATTAFISASIATEADSTAFRLPGRVRLLGHYCGDLANVIPES
jgi:hypothetical protein